jgi:hypothetical protein
MKTIKNMLGWLMVAGGIFGLLFGGTTHGRAFYICLGVLILLGLLLGFGLEKFADNFVKFIEWLINITLEALHLGGKKK